MKKVKKNKIICPICSRTTKLNVKLTAVSLYFCNKCSHRFTDPKSIIYTEEYKNKYFLEAHSNWFKYPDFKLYNSLKNLFKKKNSKNFSILDIGCGNGNFLKYLSKEFKEINLTGIDHYKNKKNKRINFLYGDIDKNKKLKKYDVVISIAVIEHIEDVNKFIKLQKKLCKKNGFIINVTINESSFLYRASRILNFFSISTPIEKLYDKHHLNHFSVDSLTNLYKKNKLNRITLELSQFNLDALTLPSKNFFIKNIYKMLVFFIYKIEKILKNTNQQAIIFENQK